MNKNKASFKVEPNNVTLLSSDGNDFDSGAVLKGYHLVCEWEDEESEYFFVVTSDAAVLNDTPITVI